MVSNRYTTNVLHIKDTKLVRYTLVFLLFLIALNAFAGGYYGMAGARNVPLDWLEGSPFKNYFVPALILFILVGGCCLLGAIMVLMRHRLAAKAAMVSSIVILVWIGVQLSIIGYVSWMQPAVAGTGIVILILSRSLSAQLSSLREIE